MRLRRFVRRQVVAAGLLAGCAATSCVRAALPPGGDWPAWRGDGSGISADTNLPVFWSATNGVRWRAALPGEGSSSPIVLGRRVVVTASIDHGTNRLVLCLESRDGRLLWQQQIVSPRIPRTDPKSGYAPATPATDGKRLYVFLDYAGLLALDLDGRLLWTLPIAPFQSSYNIAASPVVFRDRVIQCCDQAHNGYLLAVDAATGNVLWKTPRELKCQYSSPLLLEHHGAWQVVLGATTVKAYDPLDGREIWSCRGLDEVVAPSPVPGDDGLVYATSGRNGPTVAIDPGGAGDVTETRMRLQVPTGGPYVPSPVFDRLLVVPSDDGVLRLMATQRETRVAARLQAHFTASPVVAGHRLYWTAESGDTYVFDTRRLGDATPALPLLAVNPLGEPPCLASPAIADGCLYIRTSRALYCLAAGAPAAAPAVRQPVPAPADFAELRRRFEAHSASDGPDIPVRLAVVEAMTALGSREAVEFLGTIARRDPHWDVCELAAKGVAASDTPATVPALLAMANDRRDYLKVIAAGGLGRLRAVEAAPLLLGGVTNAQAMVRVARLQALAEIAQAPAVATSPIQQALAAALADGEGSVRAAAVRGLARLATRPDADRNSLTRLLQPALSDPNPLVSAAAREARQGISAQHP